MLTGVMKLKDASSWKESHDKPTEKKKVQVLVDQSYPTLCDPMDSSLPSSSDQGILQARVLEWVAFPSPGDLPDPGIEPTSPVLQADSLLSDPPEKVP